MWSIFLYRSESWTIGVGGWKGILAFELWCWRIVLKVLWIEWWPVLKSCSKLIQHYVYRVKKYRSATWIGGHILLFQDTREYCILEGTGKGRNARGRCWREYVNQIVEDLGYCNFTQLKSLTNDHISWKTATSQS